MYSRRWWGGTKPLTICAGIHTTQLPMTAVLRSALREASIYCSRSCPQTEVTKTCIRRWGSRWLRCNLGGNRQGAVPGLTVEETIRSNDRWFRALKNRNFPASDGTHDIITACPRPSTKFCARTSWRWEPIIDQGLEVKERLKEPKAYCKHPGSPLILNYYNSDKKPSERGEKSVWSVSFCKKNNLHVSVLKMYAR
jgi:hypothetical protein